MKKVIAGKLYDTNTAKELGLDNGGDGFSHWCERLYQKRTGEFFLHGQGGPMTRYARSIDQNSWSGGEKIIPLSVKNAQKWVEDHLDADEYEKIFGLPEDGVEVLHVELPAPLMARIRINAAGLQQSLKDYVVSILSDAMK